MNRMRGAQQGFTALELAAAIAAGLLFLAIVTFGVIRGLDNNRYTTLTAMIGGSMTSAILSVYTSNGSLSSLTVIAGSGILTGAGVKSTTPWGTPWAVQTAGTAGTVQIRFPLGGVQKLTKGPSLATSLPSIFPVVTSASFADPNLDVTFNLIN